MQEELAASAVRCPRCQHEFTLGDTPPPSSQSFVLEKTAAVEPSAPARQSNDDLKELPRPRLRHRRPLLFTCGVVGGVLLLVCGGLGTLLYFVFIRDIEEPVTAADRELPISAEHLGRWVNGLGVDPTRGTLRKVRHLDGSRELEYEYESPDGSSHPLYVAHSIGVERSAQDASGAYGGLSIGTELEAHLSGKTLRQVERRDLWSWGDSSRCVVLYNGDDPVGNIFMARKGRRYFQLRIIGIYFENAKAINDLLGPFLRKLDSYDG
jgi:hypothetical protein